MNTVNQIIDNLNYEIKCAYVNKDERVEGIIYSRDMIQKGFEACVNSGVITDGYHTFNELYYHRMVLFGVICNTYKDKAWKSFKHHDGTMYDDYFIVGIETPRGQYSYHYHIDNWCNFDVKVLELAPEWDGHEPGDVDRLYSLLWEN